MGFVQVEDEELPVGLQVLGDAWSEATLIEIAAEFEAATHHRRPPPTTPPLGAASRDGRP
jgi:Asp-tRNA(Asn)/Glu-tRNA(Gln) amidotransferase A subunit family amidase